MCGSAAHLVIFFQVSPFIFSIVLRYVPFDRPLLPSGSQRNAALDPFVRGFMVSVLQSSVLFVIMLSLTMAFFVEYQSVEIRFSR